MYSQIKPSSRSLNAFQFEHPGLGEFGNESKYGASVDEIKIAVLEWQMRVAGGRHEFERRAEMLLAPDHQIADHIDAPDFSRPGEVVKPPYHDTGGAAEVQHAASLFQ